MKRSIYLIILFAFMLRLGLGITASRLLPSVGYVSKAQQAGYLFFDAYRRDSQAWDLAQSSKPLINAFNGKFSTDQYGGLLWISALIYRYLSFGTHQPLLIVFLAALVGSSGIIFVYLIARRITGDATNKTGLYAVLIFAFFPESILLGASQMREPFLMTLIAMSFYGLVEWQSTHQKKSWIWIAISFSGMLLLSPGFVVVTLVAAAGWIQLSNAIGSGTDKAKENNAGGKISWLITAGGVVLMLVALTTLAASWDSLVSAKGSGLFGIIGSWARETTRWNAYLLERSSGIVQVLFQALPPALAFPFVAVYGVLQPVLPAVLFEPSIPFWQIMGIFRAMGWYLLLPLVAFALFSSHTDMKNDQQTAVFPANRKQWLWLGLVVWGWIVIAALRGGGDQWDNPRYRVILLVWMALLAANAITGLTKTSTKSSEMAEDNANRRWFWRICCVETIILLVFGHWYSWRYLGFGFNIGIRYTLVLAIGLSLLVVLGDWVLQRIKPSYRL